MEINPTAITSSHTINHVRTQIVKFFLFLKTPKQVCEKCKTHIGRSNCLSVMIRNFLDSFWGAGHCCTVRPHDDPHEVDRIQTDRALDFCPHDDWKYKTKHFKRVTSFVRLTYFNCFFSPPTPVCSIQSKPITAFIKKLGLWWALICIHLLSRTSCIISLLSFTTGFSRCLIRRFHDNYCTNLTFPFIIALLTKNKCKCSA